MSQSGSEETRSRRVLVTGLSTYWGGRLAQALERDSEIEAIVGVDSSDPTRELDRTEFVRVGTQHTLLRRIVEAAEIDTVIDTRLIPDSTVASSSVAHENNVIGTMNILAASSGPNSSVRRFVFKSSAHYYGTEQDDPAFFTESMQRPHPPRTPIERDIVEAEAALSDFADKNPQIAVSILRFANVLGPDVNTSHTKLFSLPVIPMILGFDPRYQFVHEDDVVAALAHTLQFDLSGVYNVAGDGVLALSEIAGVLGKTYVPMLPPWGTGLAAAAARRIGVTVPPEMLGQLRFGRGLDNRKLKATGFIYRYTTRETVAKLGEHLRISPIVRGVREPYRYEREVEDFLRWSPHVRNPDYRRETRLAPRQAFAVQKLMAEYGYGVEPDAAERSGRQRRRAEEAAGTPRPAALPDEPQAAAETEAVDIRATGEQAPPQPGSPVPHYDDLEAEEVISLLGSLEIEDLEALRDYERDAQARETVVAAIESVLARRTASPRR